MGHRTFVESLDVRRLLAVSVSINFQPAGRPTPVGMVADTGAVYAARNGYSYGWDKANTGNAKDRNAANSPSQAYDTLNTLRDVSRVSRKWEIALPNGDYTVHLVSGDPTYNMAPDIMAEGVTILSGTTTAANRWIEVTKTVTVTDGRLTLTNGSAGSASAVNFIDIKSAGEVTPTPPPTDPTVPPTTTVEFPTTTAWKLAAASPIARFESHAFSYGGKLYLMGGWADGAFNSTRRVDVYDPTKNTWKRLADMKAPETHAGAVMDEVNGVIYFVGGHRGSLAKYTPTNEVWKYTIATDTWTKLPVTLPYAMGASTAQIVNGKLYSFGGNYADRHTNTADLFVLDLSNIAAGFTKGADFPSPRDHLSSAVIDGQIYAIGGEFGHDVLRDQQSLFQRYDPETDTWTNLADMPGPKSHAECGTFVLNGKIYIAGGQVEHSQLPTDTVYSYDPVTGEWTVAAPLPAARQGTVVQHVGNYWVMTTGGIATSRPQTTTWVVKIA